MRDKHPKQAAKRQRAAEAASILRRLDFDPDDPVALRERDTFLARGKAERDTFERMSQAFAAIPKELRSRDRRFSIAIVGVLLASLLFAYEPVRLSVLSDHRSQRDVVSVQLTSGDEVILDASTSIQDRTENRVRKVSLVEGSGYFDVETSERRFIVTAGDVRAEALGTKFEVARLGEVVVVTVAKGTVGVLRDGTDTVIKAGEQLRVSEDELTLRAVEDAAIADWRHDRLTMDGMTFGEVAALVDRRISGTALVVNRTLAREPMVGVLDLSVPTDALETLAISTGSSLVRIPGVVTFLYPR